MYYDVCEYDTGRQSERTEFVDQCEVFGCYANIHLHFATVQQMAAEGQSDKMASDMEVRMKQRCVIEFLHAEKNFTQ